MFPLPSIKLTRAYHHSLQTYPSFCIPQTQIKCNFHCWGETSPHISITTQWNSLKLSSKISTDMLLLTSFKVTRAFHHFQQTYSMVQSPNTAKKRKFHCGWECSPLISAITRPFLVKPSVYNLGNELSLTSIKVTRPYYHFSQSYFLFCHFHSQK